MMPYEETVERRRFHSFAKLSCGMKCWTVFGILLSK